MPRSTQKTVLLICTFLLCCAAVIMAAVAYATKYWVTQSYYSKDSNNTINNDKPLDLNAGLFWLHATFPVIGVPLDITMKEAYNEYHEFMNFGLWISTILFMALGILFGVVAAVFAAVNSATTPIEEITGVTGLYLWNGLACLFSLIAVFLWVGQYCVYLVDIMWSLTLLDGGGSAVPIVKTHEPSSLGYSFYLICGVAFLYLVNCGLVYLSTLNFDKSKGAAKEPQETLEDGLIILY